MHKILEDMPLVAYRLIQRARQNKRQYCACDTGDNPMPGAPGRTGNGNGNSSDAPGRTGNSSDASVLRVGHEPRTSAAYAPYIAFLYISFHLYHGLRRVQRVRIQATVGSGNDVLRAVASAIGALQQAYPRMGDAIERAIGHMGRTGSSYAWFDNGLVLVRSKGLTSRRGCKISVRVLYA